MPTVSVVVPTYRRPALLMGAVDSVLRQSFDDLEVLVCDNDNDPLVARLVAERHDDRVRYVGRPHNVGMLRNAVDGFRAARGRFVVKLDDDDRLHPRYLERLVGPLLADDSLSIAFGRFDLIDTHGAVLTPEGAELERLTGRDTLAGGRHDDATALGVRGTIDLVTAVVRADRVRWADIPDDVATAYDRHIVLQALSAAHPAAWFVPEVLASYRIHPDSDSRLAHPRQAVGALRALEHAMADETTTHHGPLQDAHRLYAVQAARALLRNAQVPQARQELRAARRLHPHDPTLARLAYLAALPRPVATRLARRRHDAYLRGEMTERD